MQAAFAEVGRLDAMLSNYRPESEWSRVNREAARRPVQVSEELFRLLAYCGEVNRLSEGTFDVSVGPLMRVWGFFRGTGRLPEKREVAEAVRKVGFGSVELTRRGARCVFSSRAWSWIPAGSGKGTPSTG
jgi:thiamine biosynthesis lipoprotein